MNQDYEDDFEDDDEWTEEEEQASDEQEDSKVYFGLSAAEKAALQAAYKTLREVSDVMSRLHKKVNEALAQERANRKREREFKSWKYRHRVHLNKLKKTRRELVKQKASPTKLQEIDKAIAEIEPNMAIELPTNETEWKAFNKRRDKELFEIG
jgi:hypothetical protein